MLSCLLFFLFLLHAGAWVFFLFLLLKSDLSRSSALGPETFPCRPHASRSSGSMSTSLARLSTNPHFPHCPTVRVSQTPTDSSAFGVRYAKPISFFLKLGLLDLCSHPGLEWVLFSGIPVWSLRNEIWLFPPRITQPFTVNEKRLGYLEGRSQTSSCSLNHLVSNHHTDWRGTWEHVI